MTARITYTFDDGTEDQARLAVPLLQKHGFKGTFFVIPGLTEDNTGSVELPSQLGGGKTLKRVLASWGDWRNAHDLGHEIANHSWSHRLLWREKSKSEVLSQITNAAKEICDRIGKEPYSWAWPYYREVEWARDHVMAYHKFIRPRKPQLSFSDTMTLERANRWVNKAIKHKDWFFVVIHRIGKGLDKVRYALLDRHLAYVKSLGDRVKVGTIRDLASCA
jgi:peptidoglycan/xylan/chitin deacetylase (PgdA/CDA1 family)